ncbi:porin [Enterobacter asburiae]|uniref:Porin n=1 Tax=Enterobacter asburiae TaxID=61645 RepID=A0A376F431_ENTAS|nr:porin [Enterobacter asburiae]
MMKRNILAVVIPALLVAGAANAAEIYNKNGNKLDFYGKVNAEHDFVTSGDNTNNNDATYAQIGFKGETQINDQLTGYGQWEYRFLANQAENGAQTNKNRLAFAGLKAGDAGSIDYGRNYGIVYDVESYTDMAPSFSGMTWGGNYVDNFMTSRSTGLLTYRNSNFFGLVDGLSLGVQYQGKNDRTDVKTSNGDGVGYSLGYDFGEGFGAIASYSNANRTLNQKADGEGDKAEAWGLGLKYDANNIYLATTYAETVTPPVPVLTVTLASLTKRRTSKLLLSTSSISACVQPSPTCRPKVKTWLPSVASAVAMQIWLNSSRLVPLTTSTKTSTCGLTTTSTCWTKTPTTRKLLAV